MRCWSSSAVNPSDEWFGIDSSDSSMEGRAASGSMCAPESGTCGAVWRRPGEGGDCVIGGEWRE